MDGDGCSSTCKIEAGFTCTTQTNPDTQPCTQTIYSGQCLELPVKYRDFKSEKRNRRSPGLLLLRRDSASGQRRQHQRRAGPANPLTFSKRYCVPNSAGPARQNDSTARCWGMAQASLDANGRPAFDTTRNGGGANATLCDCQFTDWSHDTNGGHVPGYTQAANGPTQRAHVRLGSKRASDVQRSRARRDQRDHVRPVVGRQLVHQQHAHSLRRWSWGRWQGQTNLYRFSSAPHSVYGGFFPLDPPANNFPVYSLTGSTAGPGTVMTSTTGNSEPLLCNLWPYWYSSTSFGAGAGCKGDQYLFPPSFAPGADPATWFGQNPGGAWIPQAQGGSTTPGSPSKRATSSRSTARSNCNSSATTTRSCSSTACW